MNLCLTDKQENPELEQVMNIKEWLLILPCCAFILFATQFRSQAAPETGPGLPASARQVHANAVLVDGHNDILTYMADSGFDLGTSSAGLLHTDLTRLRQGGVTAQFFSVFVDPDKYQTNGGAARALKLIDTVYRTVEAHPAEMMLATRVEEIRQAKREGKIAALMGIEGGYAIENSLEALRSFHRLGVRYMTLTHTASTGWAGAATNGPGAGLSPFGRDVVHEMNRLGMLVDVSHVSDATMNDVLDESRSPVIASHSSCRALCDVPRNIPDDLLRRIGTNGGVVMVNFYNRYLDPNYGVPYAKVESELDAVWVRYSTNLLAGRAEETRLASGLPSVPMARLVDHIDHVARVAGIDHVGLGSDFDGVERTPVGLEDVSCFPNLTAELLRRGYAESDVRKILGENFLRVLAEAESAARGLDRPGSGVDGSKPMGHSVATTAEPSSLSPREGFIDVEGGPVWYRVFGSGKATPLLMVHGGPGARSCTFEPVAELLSQDRPVILYDQLGTGRSGRPMESSLWSVDRHVRELGQVRAALGLTQVHLLGHSWGTGLVVAYLKAAGLDGVESATFLGPFFSTRIWLEDAQELLAQLPADIQEQVKRHEQAGTTQSKEYQAATEVFYSRFYYHKSTHVLPISCAESRRNDAIYLQMWGPTEFHATGTLRDFDVTDFLPHLKMPALLVVGRFDEARPETAFRFQGMMPNARLKILEDCGHMTPVEDPAGLSLVVREFLREHHRRR